MYMYVYRQAHAQSNRIELFVTKYRGIYFGPAQNVTARLRSDILFQHGIASIFGNNKLS